ncbi:ferritin-like domain-containing protein [Pseudomonas sp. Marseille-QA0892]
MASRTDNLLDWLRDAHAMEQQAEQMLSAQAGRLEHYPQLKSRIEQHIEETKGQKEKLEQRISQLGSSPSTFKDIGGKLMAFGQAVGGMAMSDEVVKGSISGYVFEHIEIATYTTIIAAAKAAGDHETQAMAESILPQEEAMAKWLLEHLPEITVAFMERSEMPGETAKK